MEYEYAGVYLLDNPFFLDNNYGYFIPLELRATIRRGMFVTVPFGASNRKVFAIVTELRSESPNKELDYKPIFSICDVKLSLSDELLSLCAFMKEQTLCTFGEAVRAIVPASIISRMVETYSAADCSDEILKKLDATTLLICDYIRKRGSVSFDLLEKRFGPQTPKLLKKLRDCGALTRSFEVRDKEEKSQRLYSLAISNKQAKAISDRSDKEFRLRSEMHIEIVRALIGKEDLTHEDELIALTGASKAQIKSLLTKGILQKTELKVDRSDLAEYIGEPKPIELNDEQQSALDTLNSLIDSGEAKAALLHGITGSGKTCVMMKVIDRVLGDGKGVILLLPEISLTPQTLGLFCSRYGDRVAVIHSALSAGERFDTYNKIKEGKADVIIGTRSAVFAPVRELGLIIIDEEQEHTYKSDMNPKYHARDIARYRCAHNKALMLLASATPSIESYRKAEEGKYTLIKLTKRFGDAVLPDVTVYDMRRESEGGNLSPLSSLLCPLRSLRASSSSLTTSSATPTRPRPWSTC